MGGQDLSCAKCFPSPCQCNKPSVIQQMLARQQEADAVKVANQLSRALEEGQLLAEVGAARLLEVFKLRKAIQQIRDKIHANAPAHFKPYDKYAKLRKEIRYICDKALDSEFEDLQPTRAAQPLRDKEG